MTAQYNPIPHQVNSPEPVEADNQWLKKLPVLLRSFGAIAVLFSLYAFLVRGWEGSNDLVRYFMLLGHTGALAAIGLASGHYLKEGKGARLLLMLALVSVSANFAILGAFILSATSAVDISQYPRFVAWSVGGAAAAYTTSLLAMLVLLPVIWIGFRTLARGMSRQMSLLYLFANIALLIPLREPMLIAVLAVLLTLVALFISAKTARQRSEVKTLEGMVALLLQFLPLAILLGRNLWLYSTDVVLFTSASIMTFIALRQCSLMLEKGLLRSILEKTSVVVAMITGLGVLTSMLIMSIHESVALITSSLVAAAMIYELSLRAKTHVVAYRLIASVIAAAGLLINLSQYGGMLASLVTMIIGLTAMAYSYSTQQRSMFIAGVIVTIAGFIYQLTHVFEVFDFGYWVTLAIVGVLAIVVGSVLESQGKRVKQQFIGLKNRYNQWNY